MRIFGHDHLACRLTHLIDVTFDVQIHVIIFNLHRQMSWISIRAEVEVSRMCHSLKSSYVWLPLVPLLKWFGPACGLFWQEIGHFLWWLLWLQSMTLPCRNVDVHWISPICALQPGSLHVSSFVNHFVAIRFFSTQTSRSHCESESDSSDSTDSVGESWWATGQRPATAARFGFLGSESQIVQCWRPLRDPLVKPLWEKRSNKPKCYMKMRSWPLSLSLLLFSSCFLKVQGFCWATGLLQIYLAHMARICAEDSWAADAFFLLAEHVRKPMISHDLSKWILVSSLNTLKPKS